MSTQPPDRPTSRVRAFLRSETGNVVIDWVVITAGVVALGIAIGVNVGIGAADLGERTAVTMDEVGSDL